jgi:hypothetical protein
MDNEKKEKEFWTYIWTKKIHVKVIQISLFLNPNLHLMFLKDQNHFFSLPCGFMFRIFAIVATPWMASCPFWIQPSKNPQIQP